MNPVLTASHLGILGVSLLGFLALALATERHAEHLLAHALGRTPGLRWRRMARAVGWLLLAISLAMAIQALGVGIGISLWLGWLSIAALVWVFAFPYWPWQPAASARPARAHKAGPPDDVPIPGPRLRRGIAAGLLLTTAAVFATGLARIETPPLKRHGAVHGQIGPWRFTLAEADQQPPEVMEMDIPMKEYRLRFCDACDADIRHAYLKVNPPRSDRASGMGFMGARWERWVEIPLPGTTGAGSELWLTVVGKDGQVHRVHWPMEQVSPATVEWFRQQRSRYASP
ncbi:DUF3325 domain-containing protein [Comamonas terrigena]|uniref:DUF3325 domain-containing protein n=1 Tax=Comamonas terrigena TaxID=32013 RepID=UPI0024495D97|nr:DUF3325 domain-containing protein [Comamonas terrigena]MDH1703153.1 DUF3325 domain-containing protein [Comamonas terrigena]